MKFGYRIYLLSDKEQFEKRKKDKGFMFNENLRQLEKEIKQDFVCTDSRLVEAGETWTIDMGFSYVDANGNFADVLVRFGQVNNVMGIPAIMLLNPTLDGLEALAQKYNISGFSRHNVNKKGD